MTTDFVVATKDNPRKYLDNVAKNDAVTYKFDFGPWADDNHPIISVTWSLQTGNAAISNQALVNGVASALISFPQYGRNMISILAASAYETKQVWLYVVAHDEQYELTLDGYGYGYYA